MLLNSHYLSDIFDSPDLRDHMWNVVQNWYCDGENFDVEISCSDGIVKKAHKFILAISSKYFYAALFGPLSKNTTDDGYIKTSLPFSSSSVLFLLDCIYQIHEEEKFEIDIIEFFSLCDYIDMPDLLRLGLYAAAKQLRPENCIDELNKITSAEISVAPKWLYIVTHYIVNSMDLGGLRENTLAMKDFSKDSLTALTNSPSVKNCSLEIIMQLIFCLHSRYTSGELSEEVLHKQIEFMYFHPQWWFISKLEKNESLNNIMKILRVNGNCPEKQCSYPGDTSCNNDIVIQLCRETDDDNDGDYSRFEVSSVFYPKVMEITDGDPELNRFIGSTKRFNKTTKFFLWKNYLCAIYFDPFFDQRFDTGHIVIERYDWLDGSWEQITNERIRHTEEFEEDEEPDFQIMDCVDIAMSILVVSVYIYSETGTYIYLFDLTSKTRARVIEFSATYDDMRIVQCSMNTNMCFLTPYSALELKMKDNDPKDIFSIAHSKENVTFGSVISYEGNIFHFYSQNDIDGIYVDRFVKEKVRWEEQATKVSDKYCLVDSFVANSKLYIIYEKLEEVNGISAPDDGKINGKHDEDNNPLLFIGLGSYEEISPNTFIWKLTFLEKELGPLEYLDKSLQFIVSTNVFPLDILPD